MNDHINDLCKKRPRGSWGHKWAMMDGPLPTALNAQPLTPTPWLGGKAMIRPILQAGKRKGKAVEEHAVWGGFSAWPSGMQPGLCRMRF